MTGREILDTAERRIHDHRTAEAQLRVVDEAGRPVKGLRCQIRLARHEFSIGCNAFGIHGIDDAGLQRDYQERYAAILNYATLPFYWGFYEPQPDQLDKQQRLERMADWCKDHRILAKGHPLAWHLVFPDWAHALPDEKVIARLQDRIKQIVSHFAGRIDIWDVVNEATTSHIHDNAVGRWITKEGPAKCVAQCLQWAHQANPEATLLFNDFNLWSKGFVRDEAYPTLAQALLDSCAPLSVLGIQSHMHKETWPIEKVWEACEIYAHFHLPLHWTEATVLSGRPKAPDDDDWMKTRTDWPTTPDGEKAQLDYGRQFYTVLFSHPAVEAITWWDFSDHKAWQGAPAGLIRKDMSPKPLYEWLMEAFTRRWATDAQVETDPSGMLKVRCFHGEHEVTARTDSGAEVKGTFAFGRKGPRQVKVEVK
jgi:endo-1,4-beta-xylanase